MLKHKKFRIDWVGFPESKLKVPRRVEGVYLLGDFYVGSSRNIRNRVIQHLHDSKSKYPSNRLKSEKIIEWYAQNGCLKVSLLDKNPFKEREYIVNNPNLTNSYLTGRFYDEMYINPNPPKECQMK